jgi:type II secretory pathway component PulL
VRVFLLRREMLEILLILLVGFGLIAALQAVDSLAVPEEDEEYDACDCDDCRYGEDED